MNNFVSNEEWRVASSGATNRPRVWLTANWGIQFLITVLGVSALWQNTLDVLFLWCIVATVYIIAMAVVVLIVGSWSNTVVQESLEKNPLIFVLLIAFIVVPSAIGAVSAAMVIFLGGDKNFGIDVTFSGIWAMLISWCLMHWGFSQLYLYEYRSSRVPSLVFPQTPSPKISDFVYHSYTIGTSFAVSDIAVTSSSMRWIITVHSVLSFFFNGAIIVFALSRLTSVVG